MIFDLCTVFSNFAIKCAHNLIRYFLICFFFCVVCVCDHCHQKNQNICSKMGLTSHLFDAYEAFSSYCVSFSLMTSLTKVLLMKILMMIVLGPGLLENLDYLVHALVYFSKILSIIFVDCHIMESQNPFVVSVEYFQS